MSEEKFRQLLPHFAKSYEKLYGKTIEERSSESPNSSNISIKTYEELLFFTLFSLKSGLTYDLLGFVSGMDGSNAKRNQSLGLEVLKNALSNLSVLPKREFEDAESFKVYFEQHKTLILDATEQRIQRPQDQDEQKENYSGKKKGIQSNL
jgi:hypothetical protein